MASYIYSRACEGSIDVKNLTYDEDDCSIIQSPAEGGTSNDHGISIVGSAHRWTGNPDSFHCHCKHCSLSSRYALFRPSMKKESERGPSSSCRPE